MPLGHQQLSNPNKIGMDVMTVVSVEATQKATLPTVQRAGKSTQFGSLLFSFENVLISITKGLPWAGGLKVISLWCMLSLLFAGLGFSELVNLHTVILGVGDVICTCINWGKL